MINQQISWNSLEMLVVKMGVLWLPTPPMLRVLLILSKEKNWTLGTFSTNSSIAIAQEHKDIVSSSYLGSVVVYMSWTMGCWKIGTTISHYLLVSCWWPHGLSLPSPIFLKLLSLSHSSSHTTLFLSAIRYVVVHSREVPMLHSVYCKSKGKF
jgi:hypothetical protein